MQIWVKTGVLVPENVEFFTEFRLYSKSASFSYRAAGKTKLQGIEIGCTK